MHESVTYIFPSLDKFYHLFQKFWEFLLPSVFGLEGVLPLRYLHYLKLSYLLICYSFSISTGSKICESRVTV